MFKVLGSKSIVLAKQRVLKPPPLTPSESAMTRSLYRLFVAVRESIPLTALVVPMLSGDTNAVWQVLDLENRMESVARGKGVPASQYSVWENLHRVFQQGTKTALDILDRVAVRKSVATAMRFDAVNPKAIEFLETYRFNLIQGISASTREAIRDTLIAAFEEGGSPIEQARQIRNMIGLTAQQSTAVRNLRDALKSGDPTRMRETLERALRDKRFDRTVLRAIEDENGLPKETVNKIVDRYVDRSLMSRATAIARSETIRASRMGQQEVWRQAEDQGLIKKEETKQKWLLAPDACDYCEGIATDNPDGVGLGEAFDTPDGPLDGPPAHTNCKCSLGLAFD